MANRVPIKDIIEFPHVKPGTVCYRCGWPIKSVSGAEVDHDRETGEKYYRHMLCPSIAERRRMRKALLDGGTLDEDWHDASEQGSDDS